MEVRQQMPPEAPLFGNQGQNGLQKKQLLQHHLGRHPSQKWHTKTNAHRGTHCAGHVPAHQPGLCVYTQVLEASLP